MSADVQVNEGQGPCLYYVTRGAQIICSQGTAPGVLNLPKCHGVYIMDHPQMNINDYKPIENVGCMGYCQSPKNPSVAQKEENSKSLTGKIKNKLSGGVLCQPQTTQPWLNGNNSVIIDEHPALLNNSILKCNFGGEIKIEEDGQF